MKRLLPFVLAFTPSLLVAQNAATNNFNARLTRLEKKMQTQKWYNTPAGPQIKEGYHVLISGEFLWWKAEEDGLPYTYKTNNPSGQLANNNIQLEEIDFQWQPGYRVGGGFNFRHDSWETYFSWTHLDSKADTHFRAGTGKGLFPYWAFPNGIAGDEFFEKAEAEWKLHLNLADGELRKEYYVGKYLSLCPFIGLRSAWIDQQNDVEYKNAPYALGQTLNDTLTMKCNYWGLGPRAGMNTQWWLNKQFSLYGTAAISLLYGEFSIKQKEEAEFLPVEHMTQPLHFHDSFHIARPITDIGIGLQWEDTLFDHGLYVAIKAGWEQHMFFDQNQFIRFVSASTTSLLSNRGDLTLQGWTIGLRLNF